MKLKPSPLSLRPSPQPSPRFAGRGRQIFASIVLATAAYAGSRAHPGGTLQVALVSPSAAVDPLTADAPVDALRLMLTHQLLCRVVELSRPSPNILRLTAPASLDPKLVTDALQRVSTTTTPVHGLLFPVASWTVTGRAIDLQLKGPSPDLERMLCHPAFAVPLGAFRVKGTRLEAFDEQPSGRPHLDAVVLQSTDARTAERLFAQRRVQLVAGAAASDDVVQLFATALVLSPGLAPLRAAIESTTDRSDLARFFVTAPAGPLPGLLPPSLAPQQAGPAVLARPPALNPPRELTILFDEEAAHEKSIAQRLQVKLQPLGYRLALKPTPRSALRGRTPAEGELFIQSVVLPPSPAGALVLWLELAGQHARIPAVLQQLAAAPDVDAKARELALQLGPELPVIPLVTRGLGIAASREVQHLTRDALGLPRLDDVFFATE